MNALPHTKEAYISSLMISNIKATQIAEVGNIFYHAEIPLHEARMYINRLVQKEKLAASAKRGRRITD